MTIRTFVQQARGYGPVPVNVVVKLDGNIVLDGPVPTLDQGPPVLPEEWNPGLGADAWSWTKDLEFEGIVSMEVSVPNGIFYLYDTMANYRDIADPEKMINLSYPQSAGELSFSDPFTNVVINGMPQAPVRDLDHAGQWCWQLFSGDVFSCDINILPGIAPPGPTEEE